MRIHNTICEKNCAYCYYIICINYKAISKHVISTIICEITRYHEFLYRVFCTLYYTIHLINRYIQIT